MHFDTHLTIDFPIISNHTNHINNNSNNNEPQPYPPSHTGTSTTLSQVTSTVSTKIQMSIPVSISTKIQILVSVSTKIQTHQVTTNSQNLDPNLHYSSTPSYRKSLHSNNMSTNNDDHLTTTFHGFSYETHRDAALYFMTLRVQFPKYPVAAGIATENARGQLKTTPFTPQTIADIINTTFQHHATLQTAPYIALRLVQITETRRQTWTKPQKDQSYFTLIFLQNPDIVDAIDPSLVLEHLREIVFSDWFHFAAHEIKFHRENNMLTSQALNNSKPEDRKQFSAPSNSPWLPYLDMYLPPCNCFDDKVYGIINGFPITMDPFEKNRRFPIYLARRFYDILYDFLPPTLKDYHLFPNLIGIRKGKFASSALNQTHSVFYVAASSQAEFDGFHQAYTRYIQAKEKQSPGKPAFIELYGLRLCIIPMPPSGQRGVRIREALHAACQHLHKQYKNNTVKLILHSSHFKVPITDNIINKILATQLVISFIPDFPDETIVDPQQYHLYVRDVATTHYLDIYTIEEKLKDFPKGLLAPLPLPTEEKPAASPAKTAAQQAFATMQHDLQALTYLVQTPYQPEITQDSIPTHIVTPAPKRQHIPTGETVHPPPQKPKNYNYDPMLNGPNTMDIDHTTHTDDTSTDTGAQASFQEHQPSVNLDQSDDPESIPDSQYEFNLQHSQNTRLEIMDTLNIAKSKSTERFNTVHNYITSVPHPDLDHAKKMAMAPLSKSHTSSKNRAKDGHQAQHQEQK